MTPLCRIFGHNWKMFDRNWCGVDQLRCSRCFTMMSRLSVDYTPDQFHCLPYEFRPEAMRQIAEKLEDELRDARANAYIGGATDVHVYWRAGGSDTEPDFAEAAHDYAVDHIDASAVIARKRVDELEAALRQAVLDLHEAAGRFAIHSEVDLLACSELTREAANRADAALHCKWVEPK